MATDCKAAYKDLVDAWWKIAEAMDAMPPATEARSQWVSNVFGRLLDQCGWTIDEWNEAVDTEKESNDDEDKEPA